MDLRYTQAQLGRIFVVRLEHGDSLVDSIEALARTESIQAAAVWLLGGADASSRIVVGPADGKAMPPMPQIANLPGVCESFGFGTLFANAAGEPTLHLHASFGRGAQAMTGCVRAGVDVWQIGEVVVLELLDCDAGRALDPATGFELLDVSRNHQGERGDYAG